PASVQPRPLGFGSHFGIGGCDIPPQLGNDPNIGFVLRGGGGPAPCSCHLKQLATQEGGPTMRIVFSIAFVFAALVLSGRVQAADIDWSKVDTALGKTANVQGEVHRYGIPRSDLQVTIDGVTIKPALALGGWVAFEPAKDGTMLMGDIVLTE